MLSTNYFHQRILDISKNHIKSLISRGEKVHQCAPFMNDNNFLIYQLPNCNNLRFLDYSVYDDVIISVNIK